MFSKSCSAGPPLVALVVVDSRVQCSAVCAVATEPRAWAQPPLSCRSPTCICRQGMEVGPLRCCVAYKHPVFRVRQPSQRTEPSFPDRKKNQKIHLMCRACMFVRAGWSEPDGAISSSGRAGERSSSGAGARQETEEHETPQCQALGGGYLGM